MYVAANQGMVINSIDRVAFTPLTKDDLRILGGFFEFRGFRFFLALHPEGLSVPVASIPGIEEGWPNANLLWRFQKFKAKVAPSVVIEFRW